MLDVMQIFGRAGRPQFDTEGEAIMITAAEHSRRFVRLLTHQMPIESQFHSALADHLNAEVVAGTVASVDEGIQWLTCVLSVRTNNTSIVRSRCCAV